MPFKNHQDKLSYMKEWRERKMREGYGKALYERRKARLTNEETLRDALTSALNMLDDIDRRRQEELDDSDLLAELRADLEVTLIEAAPVAGKPLAYMPQKKLVERWFIIDLSGNLLDPDYASYEDAETVIAERVRDGLAQPNDLGIINKSVLR